MTRVVGAVADATAVVRDGLRLLWQWWPTLLTIFLFGQAVRAGSLWGAMQLTKVSPLAGALLVPLAPLATVAALILALRVLSPSLRWASFQEPTETDEAAETDQPRRLNLVEDRLALLAATILPFFAVYAAQGYLKEDTRQFLNETSADEFYNNADYWLGTGSTNFERVGIAEGWWFWGSAAVAFGLRWLIGRLGLPKKHTGFGWLAAYVEVTWVTLFATGVMSQVGSWREWFLNRQAAVAAKDQYTEVTEAVGAPMELFNRVTGWFAGAIGQADAIIIVPLAWLTVGAVVYGRSLSQIEQDEPGPFVRRWAARAERMPQLVRKAGGELVAGPVGRFKGLSNAVKVFARAGLGAMLLFCIVFVLAKQAEVGTAWLLRLAVGPQEPEIMQWISPYLGLVRRGVYTVLMVSLLAAAIDRILRPDPRAEAPASLTPEAAPPR